VWPWGGLMPRATAGREGYSPSRSAARNLEIRIVGRPV